MSNNKAPIHLNQAVLLQVQKDGITYKSLAKDMATVILEGLKGETSPPVPHEGLDEADKEQLLEAAVRISGNMYWDESPEGDAYWRDVHSRLVAKATQP